MIEEINAIASIFPLIVVVAAVLKKVQNTIVTCIKAKKNATFSH